MSGAAGHMRHLAEDASLTIGSLKNKLKSLSKGDGQLIDEKVDGINIVFSFNGDQIKLARKKSDIMSGGLTIQQLAERYHNNEIYRNVYVNACASLQNFINSQSLQNKLDIFENGTKWYSADIITKETMNVILYDQKAIVVHSPNKILWGFEHNDFDGWRITTSNQLPQIPKQISVIDAHKALTCLGDDSKKIFELNIEFVTADILEKTNIQEELAAKFASRICDCTSTTLTQLKSHVAPNIRKQIEEYNKLHADIAVKNAFDQVNDIFVLFFSQQLSKMNSNLINNSAKEKLRLRDRLLYIVREISASNHEPSIAYMDKFLNKLHGHEIASIEGYVFQYHNNNDVFKATGSFAALNRIFSLYRNGPHTFDRSNPIGWTPWKREE